MQLNNLVALMGSLMVDLGINKKTRPGHTHDVLADEINCELTEVICSNQGLTTMEEGRAVLGCFYLSSVICSSISKLDAIRYTPIIKDCYEAVLNCGGQQERDLFLVQIVKLQCLVEKIRHSSVWTDIANGSSNTLVAPIGFWVQSFWSELQTFKKELPPELADDPIIMRSYTSAEIRLFEIGFHMKPSFSAFTNDSLQRLDVLHACFRAVTRYFEFFLQIPSTSPFAISIINCAQMVRAIAILSKLSLFEADGWDLQYVRRTTDLSKILERLASRMETTAHSYGYGDSIATVGWAGGIGRTRQLKIWYDKRIAEEAKAVSFQAPPNSDCAPVGEMDFQDQDSWAMNADFYADFWTELPGDWDFL
ncbi:hypothetical protein BP6252_03808 [Coleophoma cylindrospora]|uniref:Transcription factor domain-containing protein n=1 Tax=Coleophoma cylindrospora TaxID=1849047 RepID=A0A3D8S8M1_9HELO|nr:hypothetical protein BP6252_03808 [Coleophoma cylindrospora]